MNELILLCLRLTIGRYTCRKRVSSATEGKLKFIHDVWIPVIRAGITILQKMNYVIRQSRTNNDMSPDNNETKEPLDKVLLDVLQQFPKIIFALLFGSMADGKHYPTSDLDIAISANYPLSANEKISIIGLLAEQTGRAIDLIDLKEVTEPLLGQILKKGRRIMGSDTFYAQLISRHLFDQADFMPYRARILEERRKAWIGK